VRTGRSFVAFRVLVRALFGAKKVLGVSREILSAQKIGSGNFPKTFGANKSLRMLQVGFFDPNGTPCTPRNFFSASKTSWERPWPAVRPAKNEEESSKVFVSAENISRQHGVIRFQIRDTSL
jgi:hypothetical protein